MVPIIGTFEAQEQFKGFPSPPTIELKNASITQGPPVV